jgi:ADP-heptose:LPS heptosyltransferase
MPITKGKFVTTRSQIVRPKQMSLQIGLDDYYARRNKILVFRGCGGLGDIFMHRMMFEDFKRIMPDAELHFACPKYYHPAVADHPFLDAVLDCATVDRAAYLVCYNTTTSCGRTEMKLAPFSGPHRSDIWAGTCGVLLTKHDMHIRLTDAEKTEGRRLIAEARDRDGPCVLVAPISAMQNKNLTPAQIKGVIGGLRDRGLFPLGLHSDGMWEFVKNDFPAVDTKNLRKWMAVVDQADYVVSVDTSTFHCAGGLGKPLVGIFTFADGKVYGKHFDFYLVQRHRDDDPSWTCGPCYNWTQCPKSAAPVKPCLLEITPEMILSSVDKMLAKWPRKNSTEGKDDAEPDQAHDESQDRPPGRGD